MKRTISCLTGMFLIAFCNFGLAWSGSKTETMGSRLDTESIHWYERAVKKRAWMATDEVAVFPVKWEQARLNERLLIQQFHPQATVTEKNSFVIFMKAPEPVGKDYILSKLSSISALQNVNKSSPVFYRGKNKHPEIRIVLTGEIIVKFPPGYTDPQIKGVEVEYGLERLKALDFPQSTFLYGAGDALNSLHVANRLYESGQAIYAYPNWLRGRTKRHAPNDTLFSDQWHLENTGQGGGTEGEDVNIIDVWDTYQGSSDEVIAIVDDGLEIAHEDLSANVIAGQSWDWVEGDADPTAGEHGTSCAGVAAGRGDNNQGITGLAFLGGLVGHRLLVAGTDALDEDEADALTRNNNLIDIYNNSWGPADDGQLLEGPGPRTENALENGVMNGRGGLGSIYVWAGGNGLQNDDNSNYDGYANSRYTIAVAASTNDGDQAGYSEPGANILINAPSSTGPMKCNGIGITTTDRIGDEGYNPNETCAGDYTDHNYTNSFGGTSSATPLVSGIIALMLEANPDLTWRDVQHVLIKTAEQNDSTDSDWTTNGAGYNINHKYGFGRIDAQAAVNAALSAYTVGPEVITQATSNSNLPIPDNDSTGVTDTIHIQDQMKIEFVEVFLSAEDHTRWGDLEVVLTSPEGTESVLSEAHNSGSSGDRYDNWRFGSVRHFEEHSQGNWSLRVRDLISGETGTFQSWTLRVYGFDLPTLDNGPWPMFGHDVRHTRRSVYKGIQSPILKWRYQTGGRIVSSPAIGSNGSIYVGSFDNYLYSINPNGSLKWRFKTRNEYHYDDLYSSPAIGSDGIVYIGSDDGMYAINPDGTEKWYYTRVFDSHNLLEIGWSSTVIDSDGTIYIAALDKTTYWGRCLLAINSNGTEKWRTAWGHYSFTPGSSPAIGSDGNIYVGSFYHYTDIAYGLQATRDGGWDWAYPIQNHVASSPAISTDGTIYVGSDDYFLYANNSDGSLKWRYETGGVIRSSPAISIDGTIYIGSYDDYLYAINPDGTLKWRYKTDGNITTSSPAIDSDGTIYVGSYDYHLYAINPDGTLKWRYKTGGPLVSSPAIDSDGTIYIGSIDRYIYAIGGIQDEQADELAVDFGASGLWYYDGSTWNQLNGQNPEGMEEWDGGLASDFAASGLWNYNGSSWDLLTTLNPEAMKAWADGLAVDFSTTGLWNYNGSSWDLLTTNDPHDMESWTDGLAVDFGTFGLWNYDGSIWSLLTTTDSEDMAAWVNGLAVDFGTFGLWNYNGSSWNLLTTSDAQSMEAWSGGLAVDFDTFGLWNYNGSSWSLLTTSDADFMAAWAYGIAVDFGGTGLWSYDGSSWDLLTTSDAQDMEGWATSLAVDLGTSGLWNYDGSSWENLTGWDSEDIIDIDLF